MTTPWMQDIERVANEAVLSTLREAALWSLQHFEARDQANAKIHCAPVRYSPITLRLALALRDSWPQNEDITEEMARVLYDHGFTNDDFD